MSEKELLENGYRYFESEHPRSCDRFYQKKINDKKHFCVYYYDKFKDNGALDYDFEYELYEDKDSYIKKSYVYGIDKQCQYSIENIENILEGE